MRWSGSTLSAIKRTNAYWAVALGLALLGCVGLAVGVAISAFSSEPEPEEPRPPAVREQPAPQPVARKQLRMTEWPKPPETIRFGPRDFLSSVGLFGGALNAVRWNDGKRYAVGVEVWIACDQWDSPWARARADGYEAEYPPLREGDIVPVGRGLYRVEGDDGTQGSVELRLLDPKEVPAGVNLGRNSYVYPLYEPVYVDGTLRAYPLDMGMLHDCHLNVTWIIRPRLTPDVPVALIDVAVPSHAERTAFLKDGWMRPQTVRAGDVLKIGDFRHRVRNIVPPDPEHQVIGWVELDPDPLPDEPEQKD